MELCSFEGGDRDVYAVAGGEDGGRIGHAACKSPCPI